MVDLAPTLDITCVSSRSYGYTKRDSNYRLPALYGRPRYRLRDSWASYVMTVEWEYTEEQYRQFRDFWYDAIEHGVLPFQMRLMLDDPQFYQGETEIYLVKATAGFSATLNTHGYWDVTLPIEIAGGFRTNIVECPTIYGGPIDALAPDDIYGGPIDALAGDVILPCAGVDPNG